MSRNVIKFIFISILVTSQFNSTSFSQDILDEAALIDINFGSGTYIREIFIDNRLLFTLVGSYEELSVGIFDITDPESPFELGRKDNIGCINRIPIPSTQPQLSSSRFPKVVS